MIELDHHTVNLQYTAEEELHDHRSAVQMSVESGNAVELCGDLIMRSDNPGDGRTISRLVLARLDPHLCCDNRFTIAVWPTRVPVPAVHARAMPSAAVGSNFGKATYQLSSASGAEGNTELNMEHFRLLARNPALVSASGLRRGLFEGLWRLRPSMYTAAIREHVGTLQRFRASKVGPTPSPSVVCLIFRILVSPPRKGVSSPQCIGDVPQLVRLGIAGSTYLIFDYGGTSDSCSCVIRMCLVVGKAMGGQLQSALSSLTCRAADQPR